MRGQLHIDFMLALALFMFVYAMIFGYIAFFTTGYRQTTDEFTFEARHLSNVFVESAGYPKDWDTFSEVSTLGFARLNSSIYPGVIDTKKVVAISSQSCSDLKSKTDVTMNFKITLELNRTLNVSCSGTAPANARMIDRPVFAFDGMNFSSAIFHLQVW
jgi:hypothetical protein